MGVFKRPGTKYWQMRYYYDGRVVIKSPKTVNKRVAQKKLEIIKAEIHQGKYKLVTKAEQILFEKYAKRFLEWARNNLKIKSYKRSKFL